MHMSFRSKVNIVFLLLVVLSVSLGLFISNRPSVHAAGTRISLSTHHGHPSASVQINGSSVVVKKGM